MKLSMRWLYDYLPYQGSMKQFAEGMTMSGSKVECWETEGTEIENVVIGKILKIEKHPDADKLVICQIDINEESPIQIVTAATNVKVGALVPVCRSGGRLPGGVKIKSGKLRGVKSDGMMCGLSDLGLTTHDFPDAIEDGIFLINEDCKPGEKLTEAIGLCDTVVDFEITSNRPDCLSVLGLAREGSATFSIPFTPPSLPQLPAPTEKTDSFFVSVESPLCSCYLARRITNVKIKPSPRWMRERLRASGVRPINNLVDITNFVMLECGRPMHAFDARVLQGNEIHIRAAEEGETITTLEGETHTLSPANLVIADAKNPVALAGVMGGEKSGITEQTTEVILESACFDGGSVRMTAKEFGLRTESSARFEKGLRPDGCEYPLARACQLIEELGAGTPLDPVYGTAATIGDVTAPFDPDWINRFLNTSLSRAEMIQILTSLGFIVKDDRIIVPSYRTDIHNKADVAEEVARIYGYDRIATTLCKGETQTTGKTNKQKMLDFFDTLLRSVGCSECYSYTFISPKMYDALLFPQNDPRRNSVLIQNPIGEDTSLMRTTALPSLLSHLSRNYKNRNEVAWLYEIGRVFSPDSKSELPNERLTVTLGLYGNCDFFTIKGMIETLVGPAFSECTVVAAAEPPFHDGRCAKLMDGEHLVGIFGELHPTVANNFGIRTRAYLAELDFDRLYSLRKRETSFRPLPKFPATTRDLSIVCDKSVTAAELEKIMVQAAGKLLDSIKLFDVYEGQQIPSDKKSLSFTVTLREKEQTITDEKADKVVAKVLESLKNLGAQLR